MRKDYDAMAKIAVIGDSSVGKTNLLMRYVSAEYTQSHIATIGIDFKVKTIDINNFRIKLQIWDTAGQQRFRNLTGTIYQGAQAVLVTYAINNRRSFENIHTWLQDVRNFAPENIIIVIAATKSDLDIQRTVTKQEGQLLAAQISAPFFETSAKNNVNVQDTFRAVAEQVYHKRIENIQHANNKDKKEKESKEQKDKDSKPVAMPRHTEENKDKSARGKKEADGDSKMKLKPKPVQSRRDKKCC